MALSIEELRELLITIDQTSIAELTLKSDDFELTVRRDTVASPEPGAKIPASTQVVSPPPTIAVPEPTVPATPTPAAMPTPSPLEKKLVEITSPMVGTFYRAPAPDEPPFVNVGDRIRPGQTVCIIEAMKLMNELEAEVAGEIVEILVDNAQPVEYGQVLMRINPA
ncbi:MAG: acetyl-CoA carboxylase biotin carboxyl carrier protein [Cyanobacteria bacterium]|nr:acetyl-CoA carboxylase biotin carboxyl carrier protein [Cyanobacteriota bacterium]MDW8201316.1 acetyl-CoA carboxylase biotin carboxyl carrier protein [Cyanobacteriota bacterium SKYGB_h_bin112]